MHALPIDFACCKSFQASATCLSVQMQLPYVNSCKMPAGRPCPKRQAALRDGAIPQGGASRAWRHLELANRLQRGRIQFSSPTMHAALSVVRPPAGGCEPGVAPPGPGQPAAAQPHPVLQRGRRRAAAHAARAVPAAAQRGPGQWRAHARARQRARHPKGGLFLTRD